MTVEKIIGIGTYLPGPQIDNETLAQLFHINREWIDFFIGTKTRHFAFDLETKQPRYQLSDICSYAAQQAIENSEIDLKEIQAVILATATPDYLMPTSVNLIADQLGLNNIATYQLQSGCAGAIQAIDLGTQLLKSGRVNNVLVIGGDVCNKFLNLNRDFTQMNSKELVNYALFGDGAGAVIMSSDESKNGLMVDCIINQFTGKDKMPGQLINWYGFQARELENDTQVISEDYKAIAAAVPIMAKELLEDLIEKTGWQMGDIHYFLTPQLSKVMTDHINEYLKLTEAQTINCVEDTGNNGNALPFMQLNKLWPNISKSQRGCILAIESSKWIKAGVAFHVQ